MIPTQPPAALKIYQSTKGQIQRFWVEAAEAFIHKDRVQVNSPGIALDNIRESKGEGQGSQEAFP